MINKLLPILFLLIGLNTIQAQEPYMKQFTDENGLPTMEIYDLFQDSKKYIWIATDNGLCRYNGVDFEYFSNEKMVSNSISGLQAGPDGRIWLQNFKGQVFYVKDDSLHLFKPKTAFPERPNFPMLIDKKNNLWIINKNVHQYNLNTNQWKTHDLKSYIINTIGLVGIDTLLITQKLKVYSIIEHQGHIYVSSSFGVYSIKNGQFNAYPISGIKVLNTINLVTGKVIPNEKKQYFNVFFKKNNPTLHHLFQLGLFSYLKDLFLFIPYHNDQVFSFKKRGGIIRIDNFRLPPQSKLLNLAADSHNNLWLCTRKGLWLLDENYQIKDTLLKKIAISDCLEDHEGGYWVATLNHGIFYFPDLEIKTAFSQKNDTKWITSNILRYQSHLIAGTSQGQLLYLNKNLHVANSINLPKRLVPTHFSKKTDKILKIVTPPVGYTLYSPKRFEQNIVITSGESKNQYYGPYRVFYYNFGTGINLDTNDHKADLPTIPDSIMNSKKVARVFPVSRKNGYIRHERSILLLREAHTNCVLTDYPHRTIWVGYADTLFYYKHGEPYSLSDPKTNQPIIAIAFAKDKTGKLWVATQNQGIYCIKDYKIIAHFTEKEGLFSNNCTSITVYEGQVWVGSKKGLNCFIPSTQENRVYTIQDGLPSNEIKDIVVFDGYVYAKTKKGLASFPVSTSAINTIPPPVFLKKVLVNDSTFNLKDLYDLAHNQNTLEIEFQGISYKSIGKFRYKYRVIGLDNTWRYQSANTNFIRLNGLQPNTYQLEVYAINEDGVESEQPIELTFVINPPFWATWWFRSLIGLGIAGFLAWQFLQFRRRQRLLLQLERLKNQALQAQMNPHFIFNAMNAIQQLMANSSMKEALAYMARFARLIRQIFEISGEPAIDLEKEIDFLQLYLDLEQLRFKNKVEVDFVIDPALEEDLYSIPPLLIQPIIENCFKHGLLHKEGKGHLTVQLKKLGDFMYVLVEDDGVGRQRAGELQSERLQERKKSGLKVTRDRLLLLQQHPEQPGNIRMTDLQGAEGAACGTRVELWIPFQEILPQPT